MGGKAALPNTQNQRGGGTEKLRRQINMTQMKEQIKTPEKKNLNEMEISNHLSDAEFRPRYQDAQRTHTVLQKNKKRPRQKCRLH